MQNKGLRGEGEAGSRKRLPGSPQSGEEGAGWTLVLERSGRALCGVHGPSFLRRLNELSLRAPAAILHSWRAPVIWRSGGSDPQPGSPLALRAAQLRAVKDGRDRRARA